MPHSAQFRSFQGEPVSIAFLRHVKPYNWELLEFLQQSWRDIRTLLYERLRFRTCVTLQATYAASLELCISDKAGVHSRPQPKPALTDFDLQPYCHTYPKSAILMVSSPEIHVYACITHLPTPEGWKAELADLWQTFYPQSGQGNSAGQRPTF